VKFHVVDFEERFDRLGQRILAAKLGALRLYLFPDRNRPGVHRLFIAPPSYNGGAEANGDDGVALPTRPAADHETAPAQNATNEEDTKCSRD
jgi:hypothetical protein